MNGPLDDQSAHSPDINLTVPKDYEVENMRWTNTTYQLYTTMKDENGQNDFSLCIYDVPDGQNNHTISQPTSDENTRFTKMKKLAKSQFAASYTVKLPLNISYLCLNDNNRNIVYGTNDTKRFSIDIRDPKTVCYFQDDNKDNILTGKEDAMVEYNQGNYITFANRLQKSILIYDIRQVSSKAG